METTSYQIEHRTFRDAEELVEALNALLDNLNCRGTVVYVRSGTGWTGAGVARLYETVLTDGSKVWDIEITEGAE